MVTWSKGNDPYGSNLSFCFLLSISNEQKTIFSQDGMVVILQKCLQQYSGVSILRARKNQQQGDDNADKSSSSTAASELFEKLMQMDTDRWDEEIKAGVSTSSDLSAQGLINEIQKTMVR